MSSIGKVTAAVVVFVSLGAAAVQGALVDYQTAVLNTPSLISYYTFDNDPGGAGSTVADVDPNGAIHNAIVADSAVTLEGPEAALGGMGKSAFFSGSGSKNQVNVATVEEDFLFSDGNGTIELWFKLKPGDTSTRTLLGCVHTDGNWRWNIQVVPSGTSSGVRVGGKDGAYTTAPSTFGEDKWNHLAVVFKTGGVGLQVYINGNQAWDDDAYELRTVLETEQPHLTLGSRRYNGSNTRWNGGADELALYADALDAATIRTHYTVLPEPATLALLVAGGLFVTRRRR